MALFRFNPYFDDSSIFDEAPLMWPALVSAPNHSHRKKSRTESHAVAKHQPKQSLHSLGHTDVIERENDYQVHVDLPGVELKDVDLTIANGMMHVAAERKQVHEEKSEFSHTIERSYGRVQRSIPLPENAVTESGDANLTNGVLTVQFTKRPPAEPSRKLEIKVGGSSA